LTVEIHYARNYEFLAPINVVDRVADGNHISAVFDSFLAAITISAETNDFFCFAEKCFNSNASVVIFEE
jgi:hypothetical protein